MGKILNTYIFFQTDFNFAKLRVQRECGADQRTTRILGENWFHLVILVSSGHLVILEIF